MVRIVWFQKISIPPPWELTENSEGEGGLNSKNLKNNEKYEA